MLYSAQKCRALKPPENAKDSVFLLKIVGTEWEYIIRTPGVQNG